VPLRAETVRELIMPGGRNEYHVPKLARTEMTGSDGQPIEYQPPVHLHPGQKP